MLILNRTWLVSIALVFLTDAAFMMIAFQTRLASPLDQVAIVLGVVNFLLALVFSLQACANILPGKLRDKSESNVVMESQPVQQSNTIVVSKDELNRMVHDLRSPLAPLQSFLDIIVASTPLISQQDEWHDMLNRQVKKLIEQVDQLAIIAGRGLENKEIIAVHPDLPVPDSTLLLTAKIDSESKSSPVSQTYEILVVDDARASAYALTRLLQSLGQRVRAVASAEEAIMSIEHRFPNIVFSDVAMPGEDGYALARRIRARSDGRFIRLIAVTGNGHADDRRRSVEAGFDEHITKPISGETLRRLLNFQGLPIETVRSS